MSSTVLEGEATEMETSTVSERVQGEGHRNSSGVPPQVQRIVLTGFMGAGKSTIGRLLAQHLGWKFVDVDAEIERKTGMPPSQIFAKLGEFVFRRMETSAIARALGEKATVIALGGGAPEVLANRLLLEQTPGTAVIFLDAPLATLMERCDAQKDAPVRPNLQDPVAAAERFRSRTPHYRRSAQHHLPTSGRTPEETVADLLTEVARQSRQR